MQLSFSDVIGTASLLFGLVGLLGTFFFVSLTEWLNGILGTHAAWNALVAHDPDKKEYGSRLDCYHKAKESRSWVTILAWIVITGFLFFITLELNGLQTIVTDQSNELIRQYVIYPCRIFFIVYVALSVMFLVIGVWKSTQVIREFDKAAR